MENNNIEIPEGLQDWIWRVSEKASNAELDNARLRAALIQIQKIVELYLKEDK